MGQPFQAGCKIPVGLLLPVVKEGDPHTPAAMAGRKLNQGL
jgi:hypothetical protein